MWANGFLRQNIKIKGVRVGSVPVPVPGAQVPSQKRERDTTKYRPTTR